MSILTNIYAVKFRADYKVDYLSYWNPCMPDPIYVTVAGTTEDAISIAMREAVKVAQEKHGVNLEREDEIDFSGTIRKFRTSDEAQEQIERWKEGDDE